MLLERVKAETRHHHDRIEKLNSLPTTREEHVAQLEAFYGFVAPWEQHIAAALPPEDPVRQGREKTGWLEADLRHFGHDTESLARLPRCVALPPGDSRAEILGVAYVLEGSTLGGQMISRHLEEKLGLSGGEGYRYFQSYGRNVGPMWQAFRAELLRASSPEADDTIVGAARATFERLHAWFAQRKPALA